MAKRIVSQDSVANRACEIYKSGKGGSTADNWYFAERELLGLPVEGISTVVGTVTGPNYVGLTVKAFDRNGGEVDRLLGQGTTDAQGNYSITYTAGRLQGKTATDLVISVYREGALLQSSDVIYNARTEETRDFSIPATAAPVESNSGQTRIKTLSSVLESSYRETFAQAMQAAKGDLSVTTAALKDKLPPDVLPKLQIADTITTAVGDKSEAAAAIAKVLLSQPDIKTLRDVAKLNVDKLTALISTSAKPETDELKRAQEHAKAINNQVFAREPLTVLQRMTAESEIPVVNDNVRVGMSNFLQQIPEDTNVRLTPIHKVLTVDALKEVPEEHRSAVADHAKALWRTMAITPLDAPHVPPILMKNNLTSAFHVTEKPESTFLKMCGQSMGKDTARQVYTSAINTRIRNENALVTMREAIRGTGLATIDGTQTQEERLAHAKNQLEVHGSQLNLDSLFGPKDFFECKELRVRLRCSSVFCRTAQFSAQQQSRPG
jgi:hypothetical protein